MKKERNCFEMRNSSECSLNYKKTLRNSFKKATIKDVPSKQTSEAAFFKTHKFKTQKSKILLSGNILKKAMYFTCL